MRYVGASSAHKNDDFNKSPRFVNSHFIIFITKYSFTPEDSPAGNKIELKNHFLVWVKINVISSESNEIDWQ